MRTPRNSIPGKVKAWAGAIVGIVAVAGLIGWKVDRPAWSSELVAVERKLADFKKNYEAQLLGLKSSYERGSNRTNCRLISVQLMLVSTRTDQLMDRYRSFKSSGKHIPSSLINAINGLRRQIRFFESQRRKSC